MLWPVGLNLCFRISSRVSNKPFYSAQTILVCLLKGWKWLSSYVVVAFLMWCYPLQRRTHVPPRTSPVRTASAFLPGGAAMASQSAPTVLTRLMQPAVSVAAMKMRNYRWMCVEMNDGAAPVWALCGSWGQRERAPTVSIPFGAADTASFGCNTFNDICTSTFHGNGGNKMALCYLHRSSFIRGELEMITAEWGV